MPVPAGTASPWRQLEVDDGLVIYIRDGSVTGSSDLLAEALRADGVTRSLGLAIVAAENAQLDHGWYGWLDDVDEELCDCNGETTTGEYVDSPTECVIALVKLLD